FWSSEFTESVFVNDSSLSMEVVELTEGVYSNTELISESVELSVGQTTGTYTTQAISPVNFSKWGVVTFSKTTPGASILTVDVLNASDDGILIENVQNGQNISSLIVEEVTAIKLRANLTAGSTPTLDAWGVSYYTQFKITITDCSNPYFGEVIATAIRVSDSTEFGEFTGTNGQVMVEVAPGNYNVHACITISETEKCNDKFGVELA
ncbi:MAG: hypothetical protein KAS30_03940, partial [Candidatus Diapherotrites archaeon]|nr:hypothetical protein [Candidatus Diapherotrites archaeon]